MKRQLRSVFLVARSLYNITCNMVGKLPLTCSSHSVTQESPVKAVKKIGG